MRLYLATKNLHKLREYRSILECFDTDLDFVALPKDYQEPEESESSFDKNALLKAKSAAEQLQQWCLADDSGLVVPALNGAPGIYSARYAGKTSSDHENRQKLLEKIKELPEEDCHAYFHCSIALAAPGGFHKIVEGRCEGFLIKEERGGQGFGYDPLFVKAGYSKTFAQLDEKTKNRISHRRKAIDKILLQIEELLLEN